MLPANVSTVVTVLIDLATRAPALVTRLQPIRAAEPAGSVTVGVTAFPPGEIPVCLEGVALFQYEQHARQALADYMATDAAKTPTAQPPLIGWIQHGAAPASSAADLPAIGDFRGRPARPGPAPKPTEPKFPPIPEVPGFPQLPDLTPAVPVDRP